MLKSTRHATRRYRNSGTDGFTLIEVLIAMGIVVVALVGLLPLFMRSVVENVEGRESTMVSNHGRTEQENFSQLGFNNWELEIVAGTQLQTQEFYATGSPNQRGDESWVAAVPAGEIAPWIRTTTIRQLGLSGIQDTDLDGVIDQIQGLDDTNYDGYFDNALPVGTPPGSIHLKQVEVQIQGQKSWAQGGGAGQLQVETLKAF